MYCEEVKKKKRERNALQTQISKHMKPLMHKKFRSCSRLLYSHPHLRCFSKLREFKSRNAANTLQNTESSKVLFEIPKYKFGHTSQTCNSV